MDATFEEKIFYALMNNIYTTTICKIDKIDSDTSTLDVVPITGGPLIPNVQLCQFGNSNINIKIKMSVGDIIPVFHIKDDVSLFLSQGTEQENNALPKFSGANAIAFPLKISYFEEGFVMPEVDFEIKGNLKIEGNLELIGNLVQTGNQDITGTLSSTGIIHSDSDVTVPTHSLNTHNHPVQVDPNSGSGSTIPPVGP